MQKQTDKPRLAYWRTVWAKCPPIRIQLWNPLRALPSLVIAVSQVLWQMHRNPSAHLYPEMWITIVIIAAVYLLFMFIEYAYKTVWNFVVVSPADLDAQQKDEISKLSASLQELERSSQKESPNLSVSLRTEQEAETILTPISRDPTGPRVQAHISKVTMLIYNDSEKPVRIDRYKIWKLHAVEPVKECQLHGVVTSGVPMEVDITGSLARVMSGKEASEFSSLQGNFEVRLQLTYFFGNSLAEAPPQDFQVTCGPWRGGTNLKIEAKELPRPQADHHPNHE